MRIVVDMQGAQTASRFRGIGRYTLAFAHAIARNRNEHEIFLVLSGLFPETIEPIRAAFDGLLPQENIRVWHAPGMVSDCDPKNSSRRETAELMREAFLASLNPDVIHICSLFEGYVDDAVTSIKRLDSQTPISVILYDLIPLLNPDQYLAPSPSFAAYYQRKLGHLKNADIYLAISAFTKKECIDNLGVEPDRVINISTAIESEFQPIHIDEPTAKALHQKFGLCKPFVLYTGGADKRKNLPRLIEAWSKLPPALRAKHQLLFAGLMPEGNIAELRRIAARCGLKDDELLFSGYVTDDELVQLYNLCKLYIFPSWHEGFGLPALEAMACGAPVIGANTSSLPEVIGLKDALFDPFDAQAISNKLEASLTDDKFLEGLSTHGLAQSKRFSWDNTAKCAINAWEKLAARTGKTDGRTASTEIGRKRLVGALAPTLSRASEQGLLSLAAQIAQNESIGIERQLLIDISELYQRDSATGVQRVVRSYLYHLLRNPPRDFQVQAVYATPTEGYRYASNFVARLLDDTSAPKEDEPMHWQRGDIFFGLDMQHHVQLAHSGTYARMRRDGVEVKFLVYDLLPIQLADLFKDNNAQELHEQWLTMIAAQDEAICISKATADAYGGWINTRGITTAPGFRIDWVHMGADLEGSNPSLGTPPDSSHVTRLLQSRPSFLTVSTLEPRKAQTQILDAVENLWASGEDVNLVLVGQQGWKVDELVNRIAQHPERGKRLFWLKGVSDEYLDRIYKSCSCLVAASINEGFGLPLIEAARHGTPVIARDIPVFREVAGESAFYFKADTGEELAEALIEWLKQYRNGTSPSSKSMGWSTWQQSTERLKVALIDQQYHHRQLFVDISELVQRDVHTGIQRVVRSILKEWLKKPPNGYKIEPVYALAGEPYRYARRFTAHFNGSPIDTLNDEVIDFAPGDLFFALDLQPEVQIASAPFYQYLRQQGVIVKFMVYDLLCVLQAKHFPPGSSQKFLSWLEVVGENDGAICISNAVADELREWMATRTWRRIRPFTVHANPLGADVEGSSPTRGMPTNANDVLKSIKQRPSFLMVGTLEPRKGHGQVLEAFEHLWRMGTDVNLLIVGKQGWMVDELVLRLRNHQELNQRLYWLEGISDEYLEAVYAISTCLIAASYGEGFGLPLIEAAQHKLPIIARDIPVFREVAGGHAYYFDTSSSDDLATSIHTWLEQYDRDAHPKSEAIRPLSWGDSAQRLLNIILT